MQQRYYDPCAARFLAVDPVAANPGSFNRYWYANNNPYKFKDPDGREAGFVYQADGGMRHFYNDNPVNPGAASAAVDFMPIVGDVKGFVEAYEDPTFGNISGAIIGMVPIIGDAGKQIIKNAPELISSISKFDRLKGGVKQGHIEGNANDIFNTITQGGERLPNGQVRMEDGTLIGMHTSTTTGKATIDINQDGQRYKIRVIEPDK